MNNYLLTLNKEEKCIDIVFDKDIDTKRLRVIQDEHAFMLIDGYFTNTDEFIEKNSSIENIEIGQLLFELSKIKFNFYGELDGSFNIIFFDKKENYFVFTNDFWSSRPTYVHKTRNKYFFSNDLCFLKKYIKCELTPNLKKIKELLAWQHIGSRSTYYNEIDKLGPGIVLKITSNEFNETSLNIIDSRKKFTKYDKKNFRKIFESAVSNRASHFKKIMVMLSGGLDSSAVAVALKNKAFHDAETISVNFSHLIDTSETDERKYQDIVSAFTNFKNDHIEMESKSVVGHIEKYVHIFQEPMLMPNLYIFEAICENLANNRVDAVFDGNDGDNIISYGFENIYRDFINLNLISFCNSVFDYAKVHMKSGTRMLNFFVRNSFKKLFGYNGKVRNNSLLNKNSFLNTEKKITGNIFDSHESLLKNNLHFVAFSNRNRIFRKLGIEIVSPFYDKDLLNFCLNMPANFKLNEGYTRYIEREYLNQFLGPEHAFRSNKSNLASGLVSNFSNSDYEIILKERLNLNRELLKIIDLQKLDTILDKWTKKKMINEEDIINLQIFLNVNIFLNSFFKK
tara:strand:+ start:371 stop:2071 length:1701 start_codon:yes stop_codon:yes gene_type:complete